MLRGMNPRYIRFFKYWLAGSSTFLLDLLLLFIFVDYFGASYVSAASASFLIAVSVNYFISRKFVFKGTLQSVGKGYVNFILIALAGLVIIAVGMYVLTSILTVHYLLARVTIAGMTGLWNYLMNLYVNFKVAGKY